MEEDTQVNLDYDKEKPLLQHGWCKKPDWLYELPQWDNLLDEAKRKRALQEAETLWYSYQRKEDWQK